MSIVNVARDVSRPLIHGLEWLSSVAGLGFRLWLAWVFWKAGQTKIANWDSTLFLFEYEYAVPLLSPALAAWLATVIELAMPLLLVPGLATRAAVAVLFVFNIMAVVSYPDLNPVGVKDHYLWGVMLLVLLLHGPGRFSLDHLIRRRFGRQASVP